MTVKRNKERRDRNNAKFKNKIIFEASWSVTHCSSVEVFELYEETHVIRVHKSCHLSGGHKPSRKKYFVKWKHCIREDDCSAL